MPSSLWDGCDSKWPCPASSVEERKPTIWLQSPLDLDSVCVRVNAARAIWPKTNPNLVRVGLVAHVDPPDTDDVTGNMAHSGVMLALGERLSAGTAVTAESVGSWVEVEV